jgi:hypothetical protein
MKVPIYRSQAQVTSNIPGASYNARRNPSQEANLILASGAPAQALLQEVGSYAALMYNTEQEAKLSQALIGAEEGLRNLESDLSSTSNMSNVFSGDKLWSSRSKDIETSLLDTLGRDRATLQKFKYAFAQNELGARFRTQDRIDQKIQNLAIANVKSLSEITIEGLSATGQTNSEAMILQYNSQVSAVDGSANRLATSGAANGEGVFELKLATRVKIAENVTNGFIGSDPLVGVALMKYLDFADSQPEDTDPNSFPKKIKDLRTPGDAYVIHTLKNIPAGARADVISGAVRNAATFFSYYKDIEAKQEAQRKDNNDALFNRYFSLVERNIRSEGDFVSFLDIKKLAPGIEQFIDLALPPSEEQMVSVGRAAVAIRAYLDSSNYLSPQNRKLMDEALNPPPPIKNSVQSTVISLLEAEANDSLTYEMVFGYRTALTTADYEKFLGKAESEQVEGVSSAKAYVKNTLRFTATSLGNAGFDEDAVKEISNQVDDIYTRIDDEVMRLLAEGQSMSKRDIQQFARTALAENAPRYRQVTMDQFRESLQAFQSDSLAEINLSAAQNPSEALELLEAGWSILPALTDKKTKAFKRYERQFKLQIDRLNAIEGL